LKVPAIQHRPDVIDRFHITGSGIDLEHRTIGSGHGIGGADHAFFAPDYAHRQVGQIAFCHGREHIEFRLIPVCHAHQPVRRRGAWRRCAFRAQLAGESFRPEPASSEYEVDVRFVSGGDDADDAKGHVSFLCGEKGGTDLEVAFEGQEVASGDDLLDRAAEERAGRTTVVEASDPVGCCGVD